LQPPVAQGVWQGLAQGLQLVSQHMRRRNSRPRKPSRQVSVGQHELPVVQQSLPVGQHEAVPQQVDWQATGGQAAAGAQGTIRLRFTHTVSGTHTLTRRHTVVGTHSVTVYGTLRDTV